MWLSRGCLPGMGKDLAATPSTAKEKERSYDIWAVSEPTVGILGTSLSVRLAGYARCQEDGTEAAPENDFKVSACHKSP